MSHIPRLLRNQREQTVEFMRVVLSSFLSGVEVIKVRVVQSNLMGVYCLMNAIGPRIFTQQIQRNERRQEWQCMIFSYPYPRQESFIARLQVLPNHVIWDTWKDWAYGVRGHLITNLKTFTTQ